MVDLSGQVSVQTTERYLECQQRTRCAVKDRIGIQAPRHLTAALSASAGPVLE